MGYDLLLPTMWMHQLALSTLLQVAWLLRVWTVLKPTSLTWNFIILLHEFSSLFFSVFIRIERVLLSSRLWYQLPTASLSFLRIGNYQQSPNKTMKNQDEKKRKKRTTKILKLKSLELIHERKSRHRWWEMCPLLIAKENVAHAAW